MSVDLCVYLREKQLPTREEWQTAIDRARIDLVLDEFDTRTDGGFRPCKYKGIDCGFEYSICAIDEQDEEDPEIKLRIEDRTHVVTLILHGGRMEDWNAAINAAAVLTELSDGVFFDPQSGEFAIRHGVFDLIEQQEIAERERRRAMAEKDASITDTRCPECGAPRPSYRKTCKACGATVTSPI